MYYALNSYYFFYLIIGTDLEVQNPVLCIGAGLHLRQFASILCDVKVPDTQGLLNSGSNAFGTRGMAVFAPVLSRTERLNASDRREAQVALRTQMPTLDGGEFEVDALVQTFTTLLGSSEQCAFTLDDSANAHLREMAGALSEATEGNEVLDALQDRLVCTTIQLAGGIASLLMAVKVLETYHSQPGYVQTKVRESMPEREKLTTYVYQFMAKASQPNTPESVFMKALIRPSQDGTIRLGPMVDCMTVVVTKPMLECAMEITLPYFRTACVVLGERSGDLFYESDVIAGGGMLMNLGENFSGGPAVNTPAVLMLGKLCVWSKPRSALYYSETIRVCILLPSSFHHLSEITSNAWLIFPALWLAKW